MPNRIIRESICRSKSINNLTSFEETFFYRLTVMCDDFGRYEADTRILKGYLFPLKDVTTGQIEKALQSLVREEMAQVYECNEQPYLQLLNWEKYQTVRNQKSKYPKPPERDSEKEELQTIENDCEQMPADVPVIQSLSESNPNTVETPVPTVDDFFDSVWKLMPSHKNDVKKNVKPTRRKALLKMGFETIDRAVKRYLSDQDPKFYHKRDNFFNDLVENYIGEPEAETKSDIDYHALSNDKELWRLGDE